MHACDGCSTRASCLACRNVVRQKHGQPYVMTHTPPCCPIPLLCPTCRSEKHTAADFDAVQAPLSTYILQGEDLSRWKGASLRDIARSFWDSKKGHTGEEEEMEAEPAPPPKRERKSNLVLMGRDKVLKKNNYSMEQGGISAWDQTSGAGSGHSMVFLLLVLLYQAHGVMSTWLQPCHLPVCDLHWLLVSRA